MKIIAGPLGFYAFTGYAMSARHDTKEQAHRTLDDMAQVDWQAAHSAPFKGWEK